MTSAVHPDRAATTLAQRAVMLQQAPAVPATTDAGATDARVDLRLLHWRAMRALRERGTEAALARIAGLDTPDLLAGTVQDGTARGFAVALEEAISLCEPPPTATVLEEDATERICAGGAVFTGKALRKKREILIASKGARMRFSRRGGLLLVDRRQDLHLEDWLRFEDQADAGCLDRFAAPADRRPRVFSPAFLKPTHLAQGAVEDRLVLEGRLGRGPTGYPCRMTLVGRKAETGIRMTVWIQNDHPDHRLRIRFRGLQDARYVSHHGTPGWQHVHASGKRFLAATLIRACGRLRVGDTFFSTPAAQMIGGVEHEFGIGVAI